MGPGAVIGLGSSLIGGLIGASSAKRAAAAAAANKLRLQKKLSHLEIIGKKL